MGEAGVAVERDDAAAVGQGETDLDGPVGVEGSTQASAIL